MYICELAYLDRDKEFYVEYQVTEEDTAQMEVAAVKAGFMNTGSSPLEKYNAVGKIRLLMSRMVRTRITPGAFPF